MSTTPNKAHADISLFEKRLQNLYDLVKRAVYSIDAKAEIVQTTPVQIDEQLTGPYTVPSLEVAISGKPAIRLVPKGIYNIGARGRVDARSRLGTQILVWVEKGGPTLNKSVRQGEIEIESATQPLFAGVSEGWAWTDNKRTELVHLTEEIFLNQILPELTA